ncbi:conserved hypothetical protein [Pseudomonas sp. 8BK]|uniref:hypothetical protein n=1 Tax=Pseudomonas sp. 8BK TaxID=2653164 RepID=UPI0012F4067D|nr:hypothetical protein [Pseudomonas sp. 8BK]VXB97255.1 conserved hypothetical protein [Pseudomonas sp. 8BK]
MEQPHAGLAKEPGLWRVDGIGPIDGHAQLGNRATVFFSGLTDIGLSKPYASSSRNGSTHSLSVHTSWLQEFKVGSLWENGLCVSGPREAPVTVAIDTSSARSVPLMHAVRLADQWAPSVLPTAYFDMGQNRSALASSSYVIVRVLENPRIQWLVIPASELFRFYTGASARFISCSLQGLFDDYVDWENCEKEEGQPVLYIRKDINHQEASILARAYWSPTAMDSLLGPHKHLSKTNINNATLSEHNKSPLIIEASFPFTGITQLKVSGKKMLLTKAGASEQWALFAMEINHCARPRDFSRVVLRKDEAFLSSKQVNSPASAINPPHFNPLTDEDSEYEFNDEPADQRLNRLVSLSYTNQFSAFEGLVFEHRRPPTVQNISQSGFKIDVTVSALTREDGSYAESTHGILGISAFQNQDYHLDRELSLFIEMLAHLREKAINHNWTIRTRKRNGVTSTGDDLITTFPERVGKRYTWHKIISPDGNKRPRKIVWTEIVTSDESKFAYLLEMELKSGASGQCTLLLHRHDFTSLDDQLFNELLILTTVKNRWPEPENEWKDNHRKRAKILFSKICTYRIRHPSTSKHSDNNLSHITPEQNPDTRFWSDIIYSRIIENLPILVSEF